jgi:diaminopimelate decarboxylase/aspartate kinase
LAESWIVLKFGGTSVAGRAQWEVIAGQAAARRAEGFRVLLVCSAVAGVTNALTVLAQDPADRRKVDALLDVHRHLAEELGVEASQWLPWASPQLELRLQNLLHDPGPRHQAALLAMGERLSTRIGAAFLAGRMEAGWVDVREALEVAPEDDVSPARRWLSAVCRAGEDPGLAARWAAQAPILVTQGFIARRSSGETALLGRGGSDTSAALLAGRLAAERLEIWTDVPGLFSADPRLIPEARLLTEIGYAEALEMAASGARVVHPRCIRAAAATRTPVRIRDTHRLALEGTRIADTESPEEGIKTVTCQRGMAVLLLQNLDMRQQVGFLAAVFEIFRLRGVSVDQVATSETTTTVALHCESNHLGDDELDALAADLSARCRVKLFRDCVCINLVGRGARTALAGLRGVMEYFENRPLLMVSQSANDLCLSLLVESGDENRLLQEAHSALIPGPEELSSAGGVFGAPWRRIRGGEAGGGAS